MVAAWWAMLMEDLCAREETMCAGDETSESDLGRMNRPIRDSPAFLHLRIERQEFEVEQRFDDVYLSLACLFYFNQ
jgi:hypothetical protein